MQARFERNAFDEALVKRLNELDLGDAALVFGRIDRRSRAPPSGSESFHIGRLAIADQNSEPVVVDWRAPVAEPFYRATGREPMGLLRRRHFAVEGPHHPRHRGRAVRRRPSRHRPRRGPQRDEAPGAGLRGYSTLLAALERGRTGTLGDIVATIQAEQDEIIRSPHAGVLVVQGGPGTGKTVVALHRAAYLLYTHRFPLEDQGVLVIGPNRVFLRYIERVLPSLGEAGVEQVVLADLVPDVRFAPAVEAAAEPAVTRRIKGDARMSALIDRAVGDRERPLREDLVVPFRAGYLRLTVEESARIVKAAAAPASGVTTPAAVTSKASSSLPLPRPRVAVTLSAGELRQELRGVPEVRAALERMWPVLTPAQLLHDLFGSRALLRLAARNLFDEAEIEALYRPRSDDVADVRVVRRPTSPCSTTPARYSVRCRTRHGRINEADEIRTYGHIVVDEVQDLSPMQLKMVARRSLNGSLTVVGDLAQATGPWAPTSWDDVTDHLPDRRPSRVTGLSVGYRIPAQIMQLADGVMHAATPGLRSPRSVREGDALPEFVSVTSPTEVGQAVAAATKALTAERDGMSVVVVVPDEMAGEISAALDAAGIAHGRAAATGLDVQVTVVPISLAKGLEVDGVVVVEPARIVSLGDPGPPGPVRRLHPSHAATDDRPRRTAARAARRRRRRAGRRRTHLRLTRSGRPSSHWSISGRHRRHRRQTRTRRGDEDWMRLL